MESIDPLKAAHMLCSEIMEHANKSTAKTYNHLFIESCLPLLTRPDLEQSLKKRIIQAQKKLDLLQRPPLHPRPTSLSTIREAASLVSTTSPEIDCSSKNEALALYEIVKSNAEKLTSKKELLLQVINIVSIDAYFNKNPPYPEEVDISEFMLDALEKLTLLGIHLTDPQHPVWADYKPNALKELEKT